MREDLLRKSKELFKWETTDMKNSQRTHKKAEELLKENDYSDVFECWNYILRNDCDTEEKVIRFVELMFSFVDYPVIVPYPYDPYDFIGYIYSKVDLKKNWDLFGDTFDSFANQILESSNNIDLVKNPYYQFWKDPKILEMANKYGKK